MIFNCYRICLFSLAILLGSGIYGQRKLITAVKDCMPQTNPYIAGNDFNSFFNGGMASTKLDVYNVNQELLDATLFFAINRWRYKHHRSILTHSSSLDKITHTFVSELRGRRFSDNTNRRYRINKYVNRCWKFIGFNGGMNAVNIEYVQSVNYLRGRKFYYNKKAGNSLNLFYGKRPTGKDTLKSIPSPIQAYTYESFVNYLLSRMLLGKTGKNLRAKAYSSFSCRVMIDCTTLNRTKIPYAKAMVVFGGYRLKLISDLTAGS